MADPAVAPAPALWLVDKTAGPTSHDIVAAARRRLGGRGVKVGHSGTLDPFATGLLVMLVGRATRLAPYLAGLDKTYRATVRTGFTSQSLDPEGPIARSGTPASSAEMRDVLPGFVGRQAQRVPALSAVKVGGERLYAKARRGEEVAPTGGLDPLAGLRHLPVRILSEEETARVLHGGRVADDAPDAESVALVSGGRLVAVATREGGALRPAVVIGSPA